MKKPFKIKQLASAFLVSSLLLISMSASAAFKVYGVFSGTDSLNSKIPTGLVLAQPYNTEKAIEALSLSMGAHNVITLGGGGTGAGKVDFKTVVLTKKVDVSSPVFFEAVSEGQFFAELRFDYVAQIGGAGPGSAQVFTEVTMETVYVESITQASSDGDDFLREVIKLKPVIIKTKTFTQDPHTGNYGNPTACFGWNLEQNRSVSC